MRQSVLVMAGGLAVVALIAGACGGTEPANGDAPAALPALETTSSTIAPASTDSVSTTTTRPETLPPSTTTTPVTSTTEALPVVETRPFGQPRPEWIGTQLLALRPGDDLGVALPTPPDLVDRQFWTIDHLPPPADSTFESSLISPPPPDVLVRSTWREGCPVPIDALAYGQVSFYGFDGLFHTGEFIVHRDFGEAVVGIFSALHEARFPIEEMRVTTLSELDAHPTGDSNNTASFVCRNAVNSSRWSRHAHGGAIDINPFHNPFRRGDLVLPELASAYIDRTNERPGMVTPEVVALFRDIGWGWGGNWRSVDDWMHFSDTGN